MTTLSIRLESEGPLLVLQDMDWGVAEACLISDRFLTSLVAESEYRLGHRHSVAE